MAEVCERCGKSVPKLEKCYFCERWVCNGCVKSIRNAYLLKKERIVICKDCWTDMEKRKKFKSM